MRRAGNIADINTSSIYDLCFEVGGYSATQDLDNIYLGYKRTIALKPTVKLTARFQTDEACAVFLDWWKSQTSRGVDYFIVQINFFGTIGYYGIEQLTPLVNTLNKDTQAVSFTSRIIFDPSDVENTPPVVEDITIYMNENTVDNFIQLEGIDEENDPMTFHIEVPPAFGTLRGAPPVLLYTPDPGFKGTDCFSYSASDYWSTGDPAVVELIVDSEIIPDHIVQYSVTGPIRLTGNFKYDIGDGIWRTKFGGYVDPEGNTVLRVASVDHNIDPRDDTLIGVSIEQFGSRLDYSNYCNNPNILNFSVLSGAGTCIGTNFDSIFESSALGNIPDATEFSFALATQARRMFYGSTVVNVSDIQMDDCQYLSEAFAETPNLENVGHFYSTTGTKFADGMFRNSNIKCIGRLNTTGRLNTDDMFDGANNLVYPDTATQELLTTGNGTDWINPINCGVKALIPIVITSGTCLIVDPGDVCVSTATYQADIIDESGSVAYVWAVTGGTIISGQNTNEIQVSVTSDIPTNVAVSYTATDDVSLSQSPTLNDTQDRTYDFIDIQIPKSYSQINLRTFIDANNPTSATKIKLINSVENCSMVSGNLSGLSVELVNNSYIEGFIKGRTSTNYSTNSGLTLTSPLLLTNNGYIYGAGGYGGQGGKGANDTYTTNHSYEYYSGSVYGDKNQWNYNCYYGTVRVFIDYKQVGGDGNCQYTGPYTSPSVYGVNNGKLYRGSYKASDGDRKIFSVILKWTLNHDRVGGTGGLGGRGRGYGYGNAGGSAGGASSPSGGNSGGTGGTGGTWGTTGNTGYTGAGGGSAGGGGYAHAPAIVGSSHLLTGSKIGNTAGGVQ